jgi:hypothetical protein
MVTSLPKTATRQRLDRLSALTPEQLDDGLRWLASYVPGTFDAVMNAVDPFPFDQPDDPEPVCATCGATIGIFVAFGLDWRHYEGNTLGDSEIYDADHPARLTWRQPE